LLDDTSKKSALIYAISTTGILGICAGLIFIAKGNFNIKITVHRTKKKTKS